MKSKIHLCLGKIIIFLKTNQRLKFKILKNCKNLKEVENKSDIMIKRDVRGKKMQGGG